jgi:hypothetical protein
MQLSSEENRKQNCPHCAAHIPVGVRYCPYCGELIGSPSADKRRWMVGVVSLLLVIGGGAVAFILLQGRGGERAPLPPLATRAVASMEPEVTVSAGQTSSTAVPTPTVLAAPTLTPSLSTLPPPLADVPFPEQTVDYPLEWPEELRLPAPFGLVEAESGPLVEGSRTGWGGKLHFPDGPASAVAALETFFEESAWQISEQVGLGDGASLLFVSAVDGEEEAMIVVDREPAPTAGSRLLLTVAVSQERE